MYVDFPLKATPPYSLHLQLNPKIFSPLFLFIFSMGNEAIGKACEALSGDLIQANSKFISSLIQPLNPLTTTTTKPSRAGPSPGYHLAVGDVQLAVALVAKEEGVHPLRRRIAMEIH